jgi:hypothetical protein
MASELFLLARSDDQWLPALAAQTRRLGRGRQQRDFKEDVPALIRRQNVGDDLKGRIFFDNPLRFYPRLRARLEMRQPLAVTAAS